MRSESDFLRGGYGKKRGGWRRYKGRNRRGKGLIGEEPLIWRTQSAGPLWGVLLSEFPLSSSFFISIQEKKERKKKKKTPLLFGAMWEFFFPPLLSEKKVWGVGADVGICQRERVLACGEKGRGGVEVFF